MSDNVLILEQLAVKIHSKGLIDREVLDTLRDVGVLSLTDYCARKNISLEETLEFLGYVSPQIGFLLLQINAPRMILNWNGAVSVLGLIEPTFIANYLGTKIRRKDAPFLSGTKIITHRNVIDYVLTSAKVGGKIAFIPMETDSLTVTYETPLRGLGTMLTYISLNRQIDVEPRRIFDISSYRDILGRYVAMIQAILSGLSKRIVDLSRDMLDKKDNESIIDLAIESFGIHLLNEESFVRFLLDAYVELKAIMETMRMCLLQIKIHSTEKNNK